MADQNLAIISTHLAFSTRSDGQEVKTGLTKHDTRLVPRS